jgi:hypothetical protein
MMTLAQKKWTMSEESKNIRDLLHDIDYSRAIDLRGESIGDVCVCGCEVFVMLGGFVDGEIAFYFLDGECASCGSMVTLPTPKKEGDIDVY